MTSICESGMLALSDPFRTYNDEEEFEERLFEITYKGEIVFFPAYSLAIKKNRANLIDEEVEAQLRKYEKEFFITNPFFGLEGKKNIPENNCTNSNTESCFKVLYNIPFHNGIK